MKIQNLNSFICMFIIGVCFFNLLPEALRYINHTLAIFLIFVGFQIHNIFHIVFDHYFSKHLSNATIISTEQNKHNISCETEIQNASSWSSTCQECSTETNRNQSNSLKQNSVLLHSKTKKCARICIVAFIFGLHTCIDGVIIGLAIHTNIKISIITAVSICVIQDSLILYQRICNIINEPITCMNLKWRYLLYYLC